MIEFDFDEWAELYETAPATFEAHRQTVLALAIAAHPTAQPALSACLRRLDAESEGLSPEERSLLAFRAMTGSLEELRFRYSELDRALGDLQASLDAVPKFS